jgi:FAD/FMN-containing dehydrogenase
MSLIAIGLLLGVIAVGFWTSRRGESERRRVCAHEQPLHVWRDAHERKVGRIADFLRRRTHHSPLVLRKRAVSHQVPKPGDLKYSDEALDIRDLNRILDIDPANRTCVAEPGVTFVDLVSATLRHGLVPTVVPEFKTITIGGAVAGCSVESMSFQHGGFHDSCLEYEVITSSGKVLTCTPDNENRLLFQMVHGTFGTLGVVSKLKFKLVPARPFVKMTYEKYPSLAEYKAAIWRHYQAHDVDFMDGIIHSRTEWVLSLGRFVESAPYTNRYDWTKVYYQSTRTRSEDYLRTPDYFFRYDRGVTNVHPKSAVGRFLFGKFFGSTQVLSLAQRFHWLLGAIPPSVTLDVFVPFSKVDAFVDWYSQEFDFFPLWCVPYRRVRNYEWVSDHFYERIEDDLFVDLAIYGMKQRDGKNHYKIMEDKLLEFSGIKTLISHNYYSEADFWKTWNKRNYDTVKALTDPHNIFRDLYSKTCRATRGIKDAARNPR